MDALAPSIAFIRAFARKKKAMSKMKASMAMAAAKPLTQELQQVMAISRTWARRPKTEEMAARTRATAWRTSA